MPPPPLPHRHLTATSPPPPPPPSQHIIKERGIATLWAGFPWRVGRQILCLMLFDKMVVTLQPIMFPHLFEQEKKK